ncbi:hypothetical protein ACFT9I_16835 [Streptomyces sp. NPDC057137]|uniref:hypothetical protein n=1 Tax=Streptomyces sp. NPDC057137 TaxID=3346030 RepID=UPI00363E3A1D
MRECWLCGDPVDAGQMYRVELEGGHGPRTVDIPGCADCLRRYETHRAEGTSATDVSFFVALIGTPATGVFAIGLHSFVLGAAALLLLGVFVFSLVALVRRDRERTPPLTHEHGGWQHRIGMQPEVAALLEEGWWLKGYRPSHVNGPGGL